jgi:CRP-like cAMP-binding protein
MYVEKGLAKIYMERGDSSLVMMLVPEGNLLGLSSLSEEYSKYQFSAMTYIDSEIRQIDIKVFRSLIQENPMFAKEIIEKIIADNIQVYGRFFCLTHKQGFGTVADIILCLANRIFKSMEFDLPLSRKDLAELTGMSQETVIRILKRFSDDKVIEMDGKKFKVIDYERLCSISENG